MSSRRTGHGRIIGPACLFAGLLAGAALATDCADYANIMRVCGTTGVGFTATDVALDGPVAYLVGGNRLASWDVSDPDAPQFLDAVDLPITVDSVEAAGGRVCAMGATQIAVVDATNPADLGVPALVTPSAVPRAIDADADRLLVAVGAAGLLVYSVVDPAAPALLGQFDSPGFARDVSGRGDLALLADGNQLVVVDLADPAHPVQIGAYAEESPDGSYPDYEQVEATDSGAAVYATGDAFIANYLIGVDLTDPAAPTAFGWEQLHYGGELDDAGGDRVFLQQNGSVLICTCAPAIGVRLNARQPWAGTGGGVAYADGVICAAGDIPQFLTIDASSPGYVAQLASLPRGQVMDGWMLTSSSTSSGMYWSLTYELIDVRDPFQPQVKHEGGFSGGPGSPGSVQLRGAWGDQVAYWATDGVGQGIALADFSVSPPAFGSISWVSEIKRAGDRLFAAGNGIGIYDVTDLAAPVLLGTIDLYGSMLAAPSPDVLYVAGQNALLVIDCSDPAQPVQVASVPFSGAVGTATLAGDLLFVEIGQHDYVVLDVSVPLSPVTVGGGTVTGSIETLESHGELVLAGLIWPDGFQVLASTGPLGSATVLPVRPRAFAWQVDHLYVASPSYDSENGLLVYDLTDPAAPVFVGRGAPMDDIEPGPGVLVGAGGVMPLQCAPTAVFDDADELPPAAESALRAVPNPFNPQTALRFTLPRAEPVELAIYDLAGHRVRTLWRGDLPAGATALTWDGCDDGGRSQPSGVYVARLRAASLDATARLVLVR